MARKPMMAGNWKMNNAIGEAVVLTQEISNNWWKDWEDKVDVVICPPFVDLKPVKTVLECLARAASRRARSSSVLRTCTGRKTVRLPARFPFP